jgi:hypothetical protein
VPFYKYPFKSNSLYHLYIHIVTMDLYLTTAHCRTNLCPIMEESPLESSASGIDSLVLSMKSSVLLQDVRPIPKMYQQNKRLRIETSSSESLSLAIDALVVSLQSDLSQQVAMSKARKQSKKRYNRWSSNNDTPPYQRAKRGMKENKDVSPKRPCRK